MDAPPEVALWMALNRLHCLLYNLQLLIDLSDRRRDALDRLSRAQFARSFEARFGYDPSPGPHVPAPIPESYKLALREVVAGMDRQVGAAREAYQLGGAAGLREISPDLVREMPRKIDEFEAAMRIVKAAIDLDEVDPFDATQRARAAGEWLAERGRELARLTDQRARELMRRPSLYPEGRAARRMILPNLEVLRSLGPVLRSLAYSPRLLDADGLAEVFRHRESARAALQQIEAEAVEGDVRLNTVLAQFRPLIDRIQFDEIGTMMPGERMEPRYDRVDAQAYLDLVEQLAALVDPAFVDISWFTLDHACGGVSHRLMDRPEYRAAIETARTRLCAAAAASGLSNLDTDPVRAAQAVRTWIVGELGLTVSEAGATGMDQALEWLSEPALARVDPRSEQSPQRQDLPVLPRPVRLAGQSLRQAEKERSDLIEKGLSIGELREQQFEHIRDHGSDAYPDAKDLPEFATWYRHVRTYLSALNGPQRSPVAGRTGRSLVSHDGSAAG